MSTTNKTPSSKKIRSSIYNDKLSADVCYPDGGLSAGGFPFVRFPAMGGGLPLRWGESVHNARAESEDAGFFAVDDDASSIEDLASRAAVEGGYPIYFDCDFDNARAVHYVK